MAKEPFIDGRANQQLLLYLYFVCQMAMGTAQKSHSDPLYFMHCVHKIRHVVILKFETQKYRDRMAYSAEGFFLPPRGGFFSFEEDSPFK